MRVFVGSLPRGIPLSAVERIPYKSIHIVISAWNRLEIKEEHLFDELFAQLRRIDFGPSKN
jgi:hypothetical protein